MILSLNKKDIMSEVAQTTAYVGAKMGEYSTIGITGADASMLERFWLEARNAICRAFRQFLEEDSLADGQMMLKLKISKSFDLAMATSMQSSLRSYCVLSIVAKWLALCQKEASMDYASVANTMLDDALRLISHKKVPTRPNPTKN